MALRIGLIAALAEEAAACFAGEGAETALALFPVRKVHVSAMDILICTSGIGKVNAAIAATMLLVSERCDVLLVVGTAGSLRPVDQHCFWISSAVQHDYGARQGAEFVHYSAGAWPIGAPDVVAFTAIDQPSLGLPEARIASGDAFVQCPNHATSLADKLSADLIDMETAAVAQVATHFGKPWAAIKAISDDANGESDRDFQDNLGRAARIAAEAAERFVATVKPAC